MISVPLVMAVHPSIPAKTVPEFIAYAKTNPGKINMASSGIGATPHVAGELFKMMAGVNCGVELRDHRLRSSGEARTSAQNTLYFERGE